MLLKVPVDGHLPLVTFTKWVATDFQRDTILICESSVQVREITQLSLTTRTGLLGV